MGCTKKIYFLKISIPFWFLIYSLFTTLFLLGWTVSLACFPCPPFIDILYWIPLPFPSGGSRLFPFRSKDRIGWAVPRVKGGAMVYPYLVETGEVNDYYNLENKSIYRITIRGSRYRVLILFYRRKLPRKEFVSKVNLQGSINLCPGR